MVEVLTWNDYGESTYIGPIGADQPASQAWVNGPHTGLLQLTAYYASAFKSGAFTLPTTDSITLSARPHTKDAVAANDPVGKPTNAELSEDKAWVDVLLSSPGTVTVTTGDGTTQTFEAGAGSSRFSMPLVVGSGMSASVVRNGANVVECKPTGYTFTDKPETYNFNYFVAGCSS